MDYERVFNYRNIFLCACLGGAIYCKIILPYIYLGEEKQKIIKIPIEFSGLYAADTSSGSTIAFPIIPTFHS